jgi:hypothetical protein
MAKCVLHVFVAYAVLARALRDLHLDKVALSSARVKFYLSGRRSEAGAVPPPATALEPRRVSLGLSALMRAPARQGGSSLTWLLRDAGRRDHPLIDGLPGPCRAFTLDGTQSDLGIVLGPSRRLVFRAGSRRARRYSRSITSQVLVSARKIANVRLGNNLGNKLSDSETHSAAQDSTSTGCINPPAL